MTAHTCRTLTPGCFRCELNQDEFEWARRDDAREALEVVYDGATFTELDALIDQLADRGLEIRRK